MGEPDRVPTMKCPECGFECEDFDGFGVLACDKCGYCAHPDIYGGVCLACDRTITLGEDR